MVKKVTFTNMHGCVHIRTWVHIWTCTLIISMIQQSSMKWHSVGRSEVIMNNHGIIPLTYRTLHLPISTVCKLIFSFTCAKRPKVCKEIPNRIFFRTSAGRIFTLNPVRYFFTLDQNLTSSRWAWHLCESNFCLSDVAYPRRGARPRWKWATRLLGASYFHRLKCAQAQIFFMTCSLNGVYSRKLPVRFIVPMVVCAHLSWRYYECPWSNDDEKSHGASVNSWTGKGCHKYMYKYIYTLIYILIASSALFFSYRKTHCITHCSCRSYCAIWHFCWKAVCAPVYQFVRSYVLWRILHVRYDILKLFLSFSLLSI